MAAMRDGQRLGSLQKDLSFIKDLLDYRLAAHPRVYLFVEDRRPWVNWDKRVYLSFVRRGNVVLDIGANVGAHSVFLSHLVGDRGSVLAFEPLPSNLDALTATIRRRSRSDNVKVFPTAVGGPGSASRRVTIRAPGNDLTQASLRQQAAESWVDQPAREYIVSLTSLDSQPEIKAQASIDFIKIDVEGGELDALKGGADTIGRHRPLIYCEVYERWTSAFGYAPADLLGYARSLGYAGARAISKGQLLALPLDRDPPPGIFDTSSDVLFYADKHRPLVEEFDERYLN